MTTKSLQDIDPSKALGEPASQFTLVRSSFERIAEELIRAGYGKDGQNMIRSEDLRPLKRSRH